ncbi:hypothetical protein PENSPDRAFT_688229 [Peniophora sp. CONT]|nr:hypothetical protein PENSPDRAFT_688229 [Peniophora sp. CONT]
MGDTADTIYGRHRQSIADIEQDLRDIFEGHPDMYENAKGEWVLPANCLPDVFETYQHQTGIELLTREEMDQMVNFVQSTPGLEVTPEMLLQVVAQRSAGSPEQSPAGEQPRGREDQREAGRHSRSSSAGSDGTYYHGSRPPSRGPPVPPSPFDAQKRQRSQPLAAPSSWAKRPVAPARRKSLSDNESGAPTSFRSSTGGRGKRTPSQQRESDDDFGGIGSPPGEVYSRPHSRAQSQPQNLLSTPRSSDRDERKSPAHLDLARSVYDAFQDQVSSLPMPHAENGYEDEDEDVTTMGLVMDRSAKSSTISMEAEERMDVLQKANNELSKKLIESERLLQNRLNDHEAELEEMQQKLEETWAELAATKREEKELRSKDRSSSQQISALENEVSKLQKNLDSSRQAYNNLQRQYQEQLAESEALRNQMRRKDEQLRDVAGQYNLMELEQTKWAKEREQYEDRIGMLERDIEVAQDTQRSLDDQKHENMNLKETIDRLRFDLDELRTGQHGGTSQAGNSSVPGSVSKSLGAELLSKMQDGEDWIQDDEAHSTTIQDIQVEAESSDDEDVIQTIITRKKKRGMSKANMLQPTTLSHLDERELVDAYTQYDPEYFHVASSAQTVPEPVIPKASFSVQTEEPSTSVTEVQTETPLPRATVEMEIQTEPEPTPVPSRSPSPQPEEDEALASSSSTVIPPTPKPKVDHLTADLPPSYTDAASQSLYHNLEHLLETTDPSFSHVTDPDARRELAAAAQALRRYHKGLQFPMRVPGATVSAEAAAEWDTLKQELGLSCTVIDKALSDASIQARKSPRRSRFYNIYNTYVYDSSDGSSPTHPWLSQLLVAGLASAVMFAVMSPFLVPYHGAVPGGPTYYDRVAWQSFNAMPGNAEGFVNDGTATVWSFLGRLGGGAARVVRNWPT